MQNDLEQLASNGNVSAQIALARELRAGGDLQSAESWLRKAAATGNIEAVAELGLQLYLAPPPSSPEASLEGTRLITEAARAGHASSAHMAALITVHDSTAPDHWKAGLDFAARAAADGYKLAQLALAFLSGNPQLLMPSPAGARLDHAGWAALAAQISASPLLADIPQMRAISSAPAIAVAESFIPPALCDWIIRRARPELKKSGGYGPQAGGPKVRTNSEVEYGFHQLDLVHAIVRHRIAMLTGLPRSGLEPPSVFRYVVGEQFTAHFDFLDPNVPLLAEEIARTGQCVATILIYLNDDFEGGETEFCDIGIRFKGRKGDAIIFHNVDDKGVLDIATRHAGLTPTRGEKWLFSQFVRNAKRTNRIPGA